MADTATKPKLVADTERAEDLVSQHALGLAAHVAKHVDYLD